MSTSIYHIKRRESNKIMSFYNMTKRRFKPTKRITSRRQAKSKANATGQVLKNSKVQSEVGLETIFNHVSWSK